MSLINQGIAINDAKRPLPLIGNIRFTHPCHPNELNGGFAPEAAGRCGQLLIASNQERDAADGLAAAGAPARF